MPVGTRAHRVTRAIHLHYTTALTQEEIADKLGVGERRVREYLSSEPAKEVEQLVAEQQAQVRIAAFEEYRQQLRKLGSRKRSAEKPCKVWADENGEVDTYEVTDDDGTRIDLKPVPQGIEMGPDHTERYYVRSEMREIMRDMRTLVGADAPATLRHEHAGEGGGPVNVTIKDTVVEGDWTPDDSDDVDEDRDP